MADRIRTFFDLEGSRGISAPDYGVQEEQRWAQIRNQARQQATSQRNATMAKAHAEGMAALQLKSREEMAQMREEGVNRRHTQTGERLSADAKLERMFKLDSDRSRRSSQDARLQADRDREDRTYNRKKSDAYAAHAQTRKESAKDTESDRAHAAGLLKESRRRKDADTTYQRSEATRLETKGDKLSERTRLVDLLKSAAMLESRGGGGYRGGGGGRARGASRSPGSGADLSGLKRERDTLEELWKAALKLEDPDEESFNLYKSKQQSIDARMAAAQREAASVPAPAAPDTPANDMLMEYLRQQLGMPSGGVSQGPPAGINPRGHGDDFDSLSGDGVQVSRGASRPGGPLDAVSSYQAAESGGYYPGMHSYGGEAEQRLERLRAALRARELEREPGGRNSGRSLHQRRDGDDPRILRQEMDPGQLEAPIPSMEELLRAQAEAEGPPPPPRDVLPGAPRGPAADIDVESLRRAMDPGYDIDPRDLDRAMRDQDRQAQIAQDEAASMERARARPPLETPGQQYERERGEAEASRRSEARSEALDIIEALQGGFENPDLDRSEAHLSDLLRRAVGGGGRPIDAIRRELEEEARQPGEQSTWQPPVEESVLDRLRNYFSGQ